MRRRNFHLVLERLLAEAPPNPQAGAGGKGGADPAQQDPQLKQQQKNAEQQGTNKAGAAGTPQANQGAAQKGDPKAEQEKQKKVQQTTQLSVRMAALDKDVAKLQAKIQSGQVKPADLNKLNQNLTAKKAVQDQLLRLYGVATSG